MKNILQTVSEQFARVGAVRPKNERPNNDKLPDNFIIGMTEQHSQQG